MRIALTAFALILAAGSAAAQIPCRGNDGMAEPAPPSGDPQAGQFYRLADAGLACAVTNKAGEAMVEGKKPVTFLPCLKIGVVAVADERAKVEEVLGQPAAVTELDYRTEARIYPIHQRTVPEPHYVVTYQDDVAVAVQLAGPPLEMPATFSGLSLGDKAQKVLDTLGKPTRRCVLHGKGPETWMWQPFPIGVDVVDGRVVGFKVTWPAGRETPH